eukprot:PhF_6_TR4725/c0_g1_i1/m.6540
MSAVQSILQRIFANKPIPHDATKEEFRLFFDAAVKDFEDSGFLDQTKFPPILTEEEFEKKLYDHRNQLMIVKFWKKNCIPCLSTAEMFKAAEQQCIDEKAPVVFYSVNIKEKPSRPLVDYQMVQGTPTIQKFYQFRQLGTEVQETKLSGFMKDVHRTLKELKLWEQS